MNIKEARERAGLSPIDAAFKIGVHVTTITNWEKRGSTPRKSQWKDICEAYGVTEDQIDFTAKPEPSDSEEDNEIVNAYDYGVGAVAPEHLPEDQHIIELEKAHDEIKALKERLSFYEESEEGEIIGLRSLTEQYKQQIADLTEEAAGSKEEAQAYVQTILELKVELNEQKNKLNSLRLENTRLERQVIELKAEAYDLMKEKAHLFEEMFKHYHEKEDAE